MTIGVNKHIIRDQIIIGVFVVASGILTLLGYTSIILTLNFILIFSQIHGIKKTARENEEYITKEMAKMWHSQYVLLSFVLVVIIGYHVFNNYNDTDQFIFNVINDAKIDLLLFIPLTVYRFLSKRLYIKLVKKYFVNKEIDAT